MRNAGFKRLFWTLSINRSEFFSRGQWRKILAHKSPSVNQVGLNMILEVKLLKRQHNQNFRSERLNLICVLILISFVFLFIWTSYYTRVVPRTNFYYFIAFTGNLFWKDSLSLVIFQKTKKKYIFLSLFLSAIHFSVNIS